MRATRHVRMRLICTLSYDHVSILRPQGNRGGTGRGRGNNRGKRPTGVGRAVRRAPQKQRMCEDCEENAATQFCADCQPPLVLCDNCAVVLHRGVTRRNHQLKGGISLRLRQVHTEVVLHHGQNTANQETKAIASATACGLKWRICIVAPLR